MLTVHQLALLLGMTASQVRRMERELIETGWLQPVHIVDGSIGLAFESRRVWQLGLVEVTNLGRRRLADMLGLDTAAAARYHGLVRSDGAQAARRRRFVRALAHTIGTNDIFVAFAVAAATAIRGGYQDQLSEWRSAATCERRHCKPDGYGLFSHNGTDYGFLLEQDRGTESARKYASKFRAYYRYRDTGQALRDYDDMPTILFVTISARAEDRIAEQAFRAWFCRGNDPLPLLLTTTEQISSNAAGVLGPIWRTPGRDSGRVAQRRYLFPRSAKMSWLRAPESHGSGSLASTLASAE
ncbi:MAG: replication-relaxation family protein [Chloroflexi bacterium]|nr:replication-relaxation family protein [Chloroflexota bacterium]